MVDPRLVRIGDPLNRRHRAAITLSLAAARLGGCSGGSTDDPGAPLRFSSAGGAVVSLTLPPSQRAERDAMVTLARAAAPSFD